MRKNIVFNIVMIVLAAVIVFGGVMTISEYGKNETKEEEIRVVSEKIEGPVSLVRSGTGYSLKEGVGIRTNDNIVTGTKGSCELLADEKNKISIRKSTEISLKSTSDSTVVLEPVYGTVFAETDGTGEESLCLSVKNASFYADDSCIYSVEAFRGTQTVNVYRGNLQISFMDKEKTLHQGECAVLTQDEDGKNTVYYDEIHKEYLSTDMITYLMEKKELYLTKEEFQQIIQDREAQMQAEKDAQAEEEARILAQGGTVSVYKREKSEQTTQTESVFEEEVLTCTIQIRCTTILDNLDLLDDGKEQYVPANGIILSTSKVEFVKEETVFDVLKRVCEQADIPLTYEWTVEYGGYYIQGINELFEFDCGRKSGWMYKVNGWYPNYGCSNYELENNDVIVWNYTCALGNDVN